MVDPILEGLSDEEVADAVAGVFGGPQGAIALAALASFCRFRETTLDSDETGRLDPLALAFHEGKREVYLSILQQIDSTRDRRDREAKDARQEAEMGDQ